MLHKCPECSILYLISDNAGICNNCAEYLRRRIESLHETDSAIEWWRICSWANFGYAGSIKIRAGEDAIDGIWNS